jgi:MFS family permease
LGKPRKNPATIPFDPAKWPFFYGWMVVGLATIGVLMSLPGQTMGVSAFTEHLLGALGMTRDQLSFAYLLGTVSSALVLTPAGKLYDKFGARAMAVASSIVLGAVLMVLSQCDRVSHAIAELLGCGNPLWVAFPFMWIGFFVLRFSGQGMLTLVSRNMLMKWFERRRGLVNGISGVFVSFGFSSTPLALASLIGASGWRGAWVLLGLVAIFVFPLVALALFRDNPEACGLEPDGALAHKPHPKAIDHPVRRQFSLAEARRTYAFWVFAIPMALQGLYITALTFHIESVFAEAGMGPSEAFAIFLPASVLGVACNFAGGWLSDRIHLKYLLIAMLSANFASYLGLWALAPGWPKWVLIAGNGVGGGFWAVLMAVTWPRFFGREHLGAISGFGMSIIVLASALGPWLFSKSLSLVQSYDAGVAVCALIAMAFLLASPGVSNPQEATAEADPGP